MTRIYTILLLLLGYLPAHAQQYFNRRYTLNSYANALSSIIPRDGKYYSAGMAIDSSNTSTIIGVKFAILDSSGNVIRDNIYQRPGSRNFYAQYNNSLYALPDKGFIYAVAQDSDPATYKMYGMLIRYDSVGNIIWAREYNKPFCPDTNYYYSLTEIKPTGTGEWLMLGTSQCADAPNYTIYITLTKLDSNFNVEWSKEYGSPQLWTKPGKILIESDGYLIGGGVTNLTAAGLLDVKAQALIIKTDTSGNELWNWKSDSTKITFKMVDFVRTKDRGYIYCGFGNGKVDTPHAGWGDVTWKGWVEKLDSSGNAVWFDTLSYDYSSGIPLVKVIQLPDSSIVVGGEIGEANADYGCLIKYTNSGQKIWQRKYFLLSDTLYPQIYDVKPTDDGGFVLCGELQDNLHLYGSPIQRAWVIKVDSRGCMSMTDPQCQHDAVTDIGQPKLQVRVYPNPASSVLNITTFPALGAGVLTITDIAGRVLLTQKLAKEKEAVDVSALARGVYIYRITETGWPVKAGKLEKY